MINAKSAATHPTGATFAEAAALIYDFNQALLIATGAAGKDSKQAGQRSTSIAPLNTVSRKWVVKGCVFALPHKGCSTSKPNHQACIPGHLRYYAWTVMKAKPQHTLQVCSGTKLPNCIVVMLYQVAFAFHPC